MCKIITNIEELLCPAEPLTFLTDKGIDNEEGLEIISKIKKVMEADENILALSAPQIGINKRIFCLKFNDQIKTFINPIITKKTGLSVNVETCVSMPGKEIVIGRPTEITVVYYNDEFKYEDNKLLGIAASLFDQQAQLLDGVPPSELGMVSDLEEDGKIEEADMEELITFYKETFLPSRLASLNEVINADEALSKSYKELKFTEGVINGRITVIEPEADADKRTKAKKVANKAIAQMNKTDKIAQKIEFNNYVRKIGKK